jgi:Dolichyl-phosphate-mannose-protein mannosyltransferase
MILNSQEVITGLLIASAPGLFSIYLFLVLKKERLAILSLLLSAFLLRLLIISLDPYLHDWDERFHALVAKNMISHPFIPMLRVYPVMDYDPAAWCCNHIWVHKQPLFLWQMAASMKLFGVHIFAMRFPSAVLGTATVFFTYEIARYWTKNAYVAFLSALLLTFSFYQLELMSGRLKLDHNDIAFMFYFTGAIWAFVKYIKSRYALKWAILVGVLAGCAILVKWLTAFLIFGGWALYLFQRHFARLRFRHSQTSGHAPNAADADPLFLHASNTINDEVHNPTGAALRDSHSAADTSHPFEHQSPSAKSTRGPSPYIHLVISFLTACIVFLPWQFYIQKMFPFESAISYAHNSLHMTQVFGGHDGNIWFHFDKLGNIYGPLLLPFLLIGVVAIIKRKEIDLALSISFYAMIFVVYAFFSLFVVTKMISYSFLVSPLIFTLIAYGLIVFFNYSTGRFLKSKNKNSPLYLTLFLALTCVYSLKPWSISKYRSPENTERSAKIHNTQIYQSLDDSICHNYIALNCKSFEDVELMFHKDVNAYHWFPEARIIDSLENIGYRFAAFRSHTDQGLPSYILNNEDILIIDKKLK